MFRDSSIGATKVYYVVKKIIRINSTKDEVRTIERLSNNDGDGYENVTKKWICATSNLIALIPPRQFVKYW